MPDEATGRTVRWRRRKEARPAEILAAALAVFAERGFAAARLDDVAARAGISKGTLYLYFPTKQALFEAVVREAVTPELERAERLVAGFAGPSAALLEQLLAGLVEVVGSRVGAIPKLVIAEAGNFPDLARFYLREVAQRGLALLAAVLRRGIARGEFRPVDVEATVPVLMAPVLFVALWRHALEPVDDRPLDIAAHSRAQLDLALKGLILPREDAS